MDLVLEYCDEYAFDAAYAYLFPAPASSFSNATLGLKEPLGAVSRYARDAIPRQIASLFVVALTAALFLYFLFCTLSYYFVYDRRLEHHPKFLPQQKRQEIISSLIAAPVIDVLTLPWFLGEVRGYSKLYDRVGDHGWAYFAFSAVWFLVFTDFMIYWIHRLEVSAGPRAAEATEQRRRASKGEGRRAAAAPSLAQLPLRPFCRPPARRSGTSALRASDATADNSTTSSSTSTSTSRTTSGSCRPRTPRSRSTRSTGTPSPSPTSESVPSECGMGRGMVAPPASDLRAVARGYGGSDRRTCGSAVPRTLCARWHLTRTLPGRGRSVPPPPHHRTLAARRSSLRSSLRSSRRSELTPASSSTSSRCTACSTWACSALCSSGRS